MPRTEKDPANLAMIARMIKAAGSTVGGYDPDQLARLNHMYDTLDSAMLTAVRGQRAQGVTWATIGAALGVTKEAVVQRFGPQRERGEYAGR